MARTRKPTKLKIEHSVLRKDRDKIQIEGQDLKEFEIPEILVPEAFEIYRDLAFKVAEMGILMEADCYMLSILSNDIFEYGQIAKTMKATNQEYLISDANGILRRNPLLIAKNKLADNILSVGKLFGLTPINRAGLPVEYEAAKKNAKEKGETLQFEKKWGEI